MIMLITSTERDVKPIQLRLPGVAIRQMQLVVDP
jgi:hypothetical protein